MTKKTIFVVGYLPTKWVAALLSIVEKLRGQGRDVEVLDLLNLVYPKQRPPSRNVCKVLGLDAQPLAPRVEEKGGKYRLVSTPANVHSMTSAEAKKMQLSVISTVEDLRRCSRDADGPAGQRLEKKIFRSSEKVFAAAMDFLSKENPETTEVVLFNGRQADVSGVLIAADRLKLPVRFAELGFSPATYRLNTFSTFDVKARAAQASEFRSSMTASDREVGQKWLVDRTQGKSLENPYSLYWGPEGDKPKVPKDPLDVTFFFSSQDEFGSVPEEWLGKASWTQFEAFKSLIYHFAEREGRRVTLRLHPNLTRKHFRQILRELRELKDLVKVAPAHCQLVGPFSKIDSYHLVSKSTLVIGSMTSVCMEAAFMGVQSFTTAPTYYSLEVQVPIVRSLADLESLKIKAPHDLKEQVEIFTAHRILSSAPLEVAYDEIFPGFSKLGRQARRIFDILSNHDLISLLRQLYFAISPLLARPLISIAARIYRLELQ